VTQLVPVLMLMAWGCRTCSRRLPAAWPPLYSKSYVDLPAISQAGVKNTAILMVAVPTSPSVPASQYPGSCFARNPFD
jgi:hypothetical protein